jgi:hypothetical protein
VREQVPGVWSHAATALRNVCARCTSQLQDAATLAPLIDHTERCMPNPGQPGLSLEDRTAVMQGLARVVATLAPAECAAAGARLLVRKRYPQPPAPPGVFLKLIDGYRCSDGVENP